MKVHLLSILDSCYCPFVWFTMRGIFWPSQWNTKFVWLQFCHYLLQLDRWCNPLCQSWFQCDFGDMVIHLSVIMYENIWVWIIGDRSALPNKIVKHKTVDRQLSQTVMTRMDMNVDKLPGCQEWNGCMFTVVTMTSFIIWQNMGESILY